MPAQPVVVLIVAAGAAWESAALTGLGAEPGVVVLKRCVDVDDLLATAASGQADVAVLGVDAPGLDASAVSHLRTHGVRPVAIVPGGPVEDGSRLRAGQVGITQVVTDDDLRSLPAAVTAPAESAAPPVPVGTTLEPVPLPGAAGPVLAVWGPAGAPGRSTIAGGVAAELARRQVRTILVDADPHAASMAQQLGILDEVSGLLSAARLVPGGQLEERFASVQRGLDAWLSVITGLPRPDRWVEVRAGVTEQILGTARRQAHVVVDTGFDLAEDPGADFGSRPGRNQLTLEVLAAADVVVVVGAADPVGLSRLARGLVALREVTRVEPHVIVNRMRPSLGWSEADITGMIGGIARPAGLHFVPDDRATVDRALVSGRTLVEAAPDGPVVRPPAGVVDGVVYHAWRR